MASESTRQPLREGSGQPPRESPPTSIPIDTPLVRFTIPDIITMLVSALYSIVDQFFIGYSVGMLSNATTNVALPLTITYMAIPLMCGIGGSANLNLSIGRGDREEAERYADNVIFMLFAISITPYLAVRLFLNLMMVLFGATPGVLDYSLTYAEIASLGFSFPILSTDGFNLIRADGDPRYSMMHTLTGAVINIILDPLFILGFSMGMTRAALATIVGRFVSDLMMIGYLTRFKAVHLSLHPLKSIPSHLKVIAALDMAPLFNQVAMMVVQIVMNNVLHHYRTRSHYNDEIPLACAGIIAKISMIFFSLVIGLFQGLQPTVSFNYGVKKYSRVREAYLKAVCIATAVSVFAFSCFQLIPCQIMSILGSRGEEYFYFMEEYFHIFLFFTFINGLQPTTADFFTSIGKTAKGISISLARQIIFLLLLIITLLMIFGIEGVMFSAPVANLMAVILAVTFVVRELRHMEHLPE